jgi:DNA-binding Lrp family transcriptional regulator
MRKELPQQLLRELLKNSKRSDRELAKVLGVSQPTITRTRRKLEQEGIIQDYTIIPDFSKMGFEILALTLVKLKPGFFRRERIEEVRKDAAEFPDAIFLSSGEGLNTNFLIISFNRNFTEYHARLNRMRLHWKDFIETFRSFIISIGEGEYKRFSLAHLKDVPL